MKKKTGIRLINGAIVLCVLAAAGSGGALFLRAQARDENDRQLRLLAEAPGGAWSGGSLAGEGMAEGERLLLPEAAVEDHLRNRRSRIDGYQSLKEQNQDMAGWITVPGTRIDYPVMQSKASPDYYLKHDFEKKRSSYGIPYAAEHCDLENDCPNVIIYGHHMKNGSMFADLMNYTEKAYWESHPYLWFDTLTAPGLYEVIGAVRASASEKEEAIFRLAYADSEEEYQSFIEELKRRALYDTGLTAGYGEPLVTLITCEYTRDEGRLLVVAKKLEDREEETCLGR